MRDELIIHFTENSMRILKQTSRKLVLPERHGRFEVAVASYPAIYEMNTTPAIYLAGTTFEKDSIIVTFDENNLSDIIESLIKFCEHRNWKFIHNLSERITI